MSVRTIKFKYYFNFEKNILFCVIVFCYSQKSRQKINMNVHGQRVALSHARYLLRARKCQTVIQQLYTMIMRTWIIIRHFVSQSCFLLKFKKATHCAAKWKFLFAKDAERHKIRHGSTWAALYLAESDP